MAKKKLKNIYASFCGRIRFVLRIRNISFWGLYFSLGTHHSVYGKNFRCWIADLRIEYAKRLMKQHPNMRVQDVSASSGFVSLSHFTRTFGMKEDFSLSKWHGPLQRLAERIACEQISADPDAGNGPPAQGVARP